MADIHQIITSRHGETAHITSGRTLHDIPATMTTLVFLAQFLERGPECVVKPVEGATEFRLDSPRFQVSDNDFYLFRDILTGGRDTHHYNNYLSNLKAIAESAAPFYDADAYEILFPNALFAEYEDDIEEVVEILTENGDIASKSFQLTRSMFDIGKNRLLPMLLGTEDRRKKKGSSEDGYIASMIRGKMTLSPTIHYYNLISQPEHGEKEPED